LLESGAVAVGDTIGYTGPYGSLRARDTDHPALMLAGGSGMAPILSLLREFARQGCGRPIRFFYGARTEEDLFHLDEIARIGEQLPDFAFIPVTERFVHEAVDEWLGSVSGEFVGPDVYMCGPPPMVEATESVLIDAHKLDEQRIYIDKFTVSADATESPTGSAAAPPVKTVVDVQSPADDDVHRSFGWYTPRKRRASLYEDVTVDTQPSILRHMRRGWPVSFEDGRGTWNENSTLLQSTDWYDFRDPGEQWERPFYQAGNATEQQIDNAMRSAIEEGLLDDFHPEWVEFLRGFLQIPAYYEHGLWFALATIARDCLSDSVATVVALQASMKQRAAQSIVLYAMDLEEHHGEFPIEAARQAFMEDAEWQPIRRFLERLAATHDWGEVIVATNLCLEPIVGTLIRRELGTRAAAANGDTITPVLARVETQEWEWARAWTIGLMRFLLDDPTHGEHNRATISAWTEDWLPLALEAALALVPVAHRIPTGIDVEQALERLRAYAASVFVDAGLPELSSLVGLEPPVTVPEPMVASNGAPTRRVRTGRPKRGVRTPTGIAANGSDTDVPRTKSDGEAPAETYDFVGIVMAKSAEGDAVAEILGRREDINVIEQPAFWDIRAKDRLTIPYADVSEQLGYEIDAYSIQHEMSTHYGRMVATDDALMLFSDPTEAMQYLMS
jgi:methane monooxygenase component A beta chain/propane monooxygenase small subunit